ncbi:hypothetical protein ACL2XQ_09650 [Sodalis sp. RH14]|uniref:hypothetical protein n=1 Tax=Sodalis sp. RH14 TaxID=3394329 RepID=UPI0039B6B345
MKINPTILIINSGTGIGIEVITLRLIVFSIYNYAAVIRISPAQIFFARIELYLSIKFQIEGYYIFITTELSVEIQSTRLLISSHLKRQPVMVITILTDGFFWLLILGSSIGLKVA